MTETPDDKLLEQAETELRAARKESDLLESIAASLLVIARAQPLRSVMNYRVHSFTPVPPGQFVDVDWILDSKGNIETAREPLFGWFLVQGVSGEFGLTVVPAVKVDEALEPLDAGRSNRGWRVAPAEERRDD